MFLRYKQAGSRDARWSVDSETEIVFSCRLKCAEFMCGFKINDDIDDMMMTIVRDCSILRLVEF